MGGAGLQSLQGTPCLMDDSMVFSLLDESWYFPSILNHSRASETVPSTIDRSVISTAQEELETTLRSSEAGSTNGSASSTGSGRPWCSIDESELQRVFDRFDEDADGLISVEELRRWCMKCSGKDVSDTEADCMISCVDRNNDGAVDFNDFLSFYESHLSGLEEHEDNNRRARENEAVNEEEDLLLEAFRAFDRNNDGFISAEELQAVLINLGIPEGKRLIDCNKMIRNVDRNGDGKCDLREFLEMMSTKSLAR